MANKRIELKGRVFVTFDLVAATGLHIGGSNSNIEIGGVDKSIIRDVMSNRPYIPGSSLRGKLRSLLEKYGGLEQNQRINQGFIHSCQVEDDYQVCDICQIFGVPGERGFGSPTRLVVRDIPLRDASADELERIARTDLPYTEIKTEVAIDRVTSAANPRQMERVPAGARFGEAQLVYSVYDGDGCDPLDDVGRLKTLVLGLQLMEDDYLGGLGSRGSGRVSLEDIVLSVRSQDDYLSEPAAVGRYDSMEDLLANLESAVEAVTQQLGLS